MKDWVEKLYDCTCDHDRLGHEWGSADGIHGCLEEGCPCQGYLED